MQSTRRGTGRLILETERSVVTREAVLMGTDVAIQILTENEPAAERAIAGALQEMRRIEALMTDWNETSQVAAINRAAGRAPVHVDDELLELLEQARHISELTHGKFDVTYAGAGRLWDFRARPPRLPDPEAVRQGAARVDYRRLELDRAAGTARLAEPGMRIGLGGIAKGYAVDRAAVRIAAAGFEDFSVNAGGDLLVRGRRGERLWWVAVRDPRLADEVAAVLPVSNASVVTSGDYERYFELNGRRYCHILDPATGYPADACQSVTVLATRTWWADALATGIFVLGPKAGMALIESLDGVEGMIIDASGRYSISTGLQPRE